MIFRPLRLQEGASLESFGQVYHAKVCRSCEMGDSGMTVDGRPASPGFLKAPGEETGVEGNRSVPIGVD